MVRIQKGDRLTVAGEPEPLVASRKYGIVCREKYSAPPSALTTTFTTFGSSNSSGDIILDGGLALNIALCATLAALRPGQSLYRNTNAEGTAMGAAALAFRGLGRTSVFPRDIGKVEPWALPGLAGYYARWRARV